LAHELAYQNKKGNDVNVDVSIDSGRDGDSDVDVDVLSTINKL